MFTSRFIPKNKCFNNYLPIDVIPNILNEEGLDIVFEEVIINKNFEKSNTEIETIDSIEEIGFPQKYETDSIIILDD